MTARISASVQAGAGHRVCKSDNLQFRPSSADDVVKPWLLSNVVDTNTSRIPEPLREFHVLERVGVRIGVIGLIEKYVACWY